MPELLWDGKYDRDGHKVPPLKVALPFQTVETVNESAQERQRSLDLFRSGRDSDWRNRLIWGDKKYVLPALVQELAGTIKLIYIDPPFFSGNYFSMQIEVGNEEFTKQPTVIEQKAYRDTWGRGPDGYLQWFYETVVHLHDLLTRDGSLYVHLDWHVGHYAKVVLDEVFGTQNFLNEIIWNYKAGAVGKATFGRKHDTIFRYARDQPSAAFNADAVRIPYAESTLQRLQYAGARERDIQKVLDRGGKVPTDVWDIGIVQGNSAEFQGFETQKPEELLRRVISASSDPGDVVADLFAGSGTTAAVAEKLGRRWIVADLGRFAIHTTRKRLLSIPNVHPFVVQNLGRYERQLWQAAEFGEGAERRTRSYRRFILDLYRAKPMDGQVWLHGTKGGRMVHVGTVDSPVTVGDVRQIAIEFRHAVGTGPAAPVTNGVDVLGWDFAFELNELAKQDAARAKIDLRFVRIPREVLDKRAVEQGDVLFFELAALSVGLLQRRREVSIELTDFVIPVEDVPDDVQRAITHWSQWIDFWAVDWDNQGDTFHNEWQSYRTRVDPELKRSASHTYQSPGSYTVVVKVIDILGNDTTKSLAVEVP